MIESGDDRIHSPFWNKVNPVISGCWEWTGCLINTGYGQIQVSGKRWLVHRLSYSVFVGDLTEGLVIDHICNNRKCVNPEHLQQVSVLENIARGKPSATGVCQSGKHEWVFGQKNCRPCEYLGRIAKPCPSCGKEIRSTNLAAHIKRKHSEDS